MCNCFVLFALFVWPAAMIDIYFVYLLSISGARFVRHVSLVSCIIFAHPPANGGGGGGEKRGSRRDRQRVCRCPVDAVVASLSVPPCQLPISVRPPLKFLAALNIVFAVMIGW